MNKWKRFKTDLWVWLNHVDNDTAVAEILMETLNQDTESDVSVSAAIRAVMDTIGSLVAVNQKDENLQEMNADLKAQYQ